jgi:hypothetical protein
VTSLLLATALACAAPPVEDKGWELKIARANSAEPLLVGESVEGIHLTVTLKNTTNKERGYLPTARALRAHVLQVHIDNPKNKPIGKLGRFPGPDDFKNLTPIAAGKEVQFPLSLGGAWGLFPYLAGKYTVTVTYETPDGKVTSNAITFDAIEPAKDAILARHQLPPGGRTVQQPEAERVTAFVDQIKVGDKVYLVYREFAGPKDGGGCSFAKRIATLPGKVEMVVVGAHGSRAPEGWEQFHLAYPHKPNGMTVLRIQAVGCDIEERLVFEPTNDKDPKQGWGLFEQCKFKDRDNYPPETLRLTYTAFVASVKVGGQAKFCLRSVEVVDREVPDRNDRGSGINIPWMKTSFGADVVMCEKEADDTYFLRTNTSAMWWVQTRSGEWKLFQYLDKPIK